MARRARRGARRRPAASRNQRTPTPHVAAMETSDVEMIDAPASVVATSSAPEGDKATPERRQSGVGSEMEGNVSVEVDAESQMKSAAENDADADADLDLDADMDVDADAEPASEPPTPGRGRSSRAGKRRVGRPPKAKPLEGDALDASNVEAASEAGIPQRRGRGRGRAFRGSGRWGKPRGGPSHVSQQPVDKDGNALDVVDDETVLPEDPEGETKVDKLGHLQGGRQYRCRTFTIQGHGQRLFMLSTEPARCVGFRDSYLFFQKHPRLFKVVVDLDAKHDLIDRGLLPHSYKGRPIGVVTARSVFREFGAQIIVGGRRIIDDYEVAAARAAGMVEGEIADPNDRLPPAGQPYNQNQYVAWFGASNVYHSGAPSVPQPIPTRATETAKRKRVTLTDENWLLEHVRSCSEANSRIAEMRRAAHAAQTTNPYTGVPQVPLIMQSTRARWVRSAHAHLAAYPGNTAGPGEGVHGQGNNGNVGNIGNNNNAGNNGNGFDGNNNNNNNPTQLPFPIPTVIFRGPPMPDRRPMYHMPEDIIRQMPREAVEGLRRFQENMRPSTHGWDDEDDDSDDEKPVQMPLRDYLLGEDF